MACLPNLTTLDTDYREQGSYQLPSTSLPHLQQLTIRARYSYATDELWNRTYSLIPHEGSLQSFSLMSNDIAIPLSFVTRLIRGHGWTLTQFRAGSAQVPAEVMIYLCRDCPALVLLECSVVRLDLVRQVLSNPSAITKRLLANDRQSYRTCQEPLYTPAHPMDPSWFRGDGA